MNAPDNLNYEFGPFLLEPHARRLSRDGEPVPLGGPEFQLLLLLVSKHGQVVEKSPVECRPRFLDAVVNRRGVALARPGGNA